MIKNKDMIQQNELRIGNFTEQGKVKSFYEYGIHVGMGRTYSFDELKPVELTVEYLIKLGFELWEIVEVNEFEDYERYVLHNVVGGSSNFEVHIISSCYGKIPDKEIIYSIDNDERMYFIANTHHVHVLQNTFALTGEELTLKNK